MDAKFLTSATAGRGFPADHGREVAVVGRSNSGKSSAINRIVGARKLARVSKTPGRTQMINFFEIAPERRLVDLPGYGFARVPDAVRARWRGLMAAYFERASLVGLVVTIDIRRGVRDLDTDMFDWAGQLRIPVLGLLSKADKLSRGAGIRQRDQLRRAAPAHVDLQLFSALTGVGVGEARTRIGEWLEACS